MAKDTPNEDCAQRVEGCGLSFSPTMSETVTIVLPAWAAWALFESAPEREFMNAHQRELLDALDSALPKSGGGEQR